VFVFSLLGLPSDLLFDGARNMVADSEMVLVLQTGADTVHTPYQSNSRHVQLNLRKPTQAIMAGIVSALGGVAPPHLNYHPSQGRLVAEYEWACGHHPFGPFSQTQGVSLILRDTMLRNNMLSLLTHSLHQMRAITEQLETIMRPFVAEPLGTQSSDLSRAGAVLELLSTTDEDSRFYIPDVTPKIAKLLSESEFIESRFTRVSNLLETHQWKEAHLLARSIFASSDAFVRYFQAEIDSLRDHMQCCVKQYTFTNAIEASTSYSSYLVQLATVAVGLVLLWFAAKKRTQKNKYDRR
jgi:hypothetical protein